MNKCKTSSSILYLFLQRRIHQCPKFDLCLAAQVMPLLLFAQQWQTVKCLEFCAVQENLLTKERTHSVCHIQLNEVVTYVCDVPHVQACDCWHTCQVKDVEPFWFCIWDPLDKNVHVQQQTFCEAHHLNQRCVSQKIRTTEGWWWHSHTDQIAHLLQHSLRKGNQTWHRIYRNSHKKKQKQQLTSSSADDIFLCRQQLPPNFLTNHMLCWHNSVSQKDCSLNFVPKLSKNKKLIENSVNKCQMQSTC